MDPALTASIPGGIAYAFMTPNVLQNGSPDGIAIMSSCNSGVTIDALGYEGTMPAFGGIVWEGIGGTDTATSTTDALKRCGNDTNDNAVDFVYSTTVTPGLPN